MDPVVTLAVLGTTFLVTHFVPSHPSIRAPLIARLGAGPFAIAYAVVSLATYLPFAVVWWTHLHAGTVLWVNHGAGAVHLAEAVVAIGVALAMSGVVNPAPSSAARARMTGAPEVRGIHHVTRHPLFMGLALLAVGHLIVWNTTADLWFMGSHALLGVAGAAHQDVRLVAAKPGYGTFVRHTSFLPNPLGLAKIGGPAWGVLAGGLVVAAALRFAHRWF